MRNCLTFAWILYRYRNMRQYFSFRKSLWGFFPHFVVSEEHGELLIKREYVPTDPERKLFPPVSFDGKVITTVYKRLTTVESEWDGTITCARDSI